MSKINSLEVVHQDTNKDSYENLHDLLIELKNNTNPESLLDSLLKILIDENSASIKLTIEVKNAIARAAYEFLLELYINDREAFGRKLEVLTAEFGDSLGRLREEWIVYASSTEAYAKRISTLEASLDKANALIQEEKRARVTATEASASSVLTLQAIFDKASARINQEMVVRANQDSALAYLITTLEATFTSELATTNASIVTEQLVRADADEALAQTITTLETSFQGQLNTTNAAISSEATARANADTALATTINSLSATVGSKNRTYYQTTAPTGSTGNPLVAGDLWIDSDDDKLYRYSGSAWVNIQDNQIGVNTAAITTEATTRATADTANANSIAAVSARLDTGDFATVKTQAAASVSKNRIYFQTTQPSGGTYVVGDLWIDSDGDNKTYTYNGTSWIAADTSVIKTFSQATAPTAINVGDLWVETDNNNKLWRWNGSSWVDVTDGRITQIEARWGVTTNVNGYVAGIQLLNGGSTSSSFTIDATKFIVKKPDGTNGIVWNGTNSRLDVSGDIYANNLFGNVVNTGNLVTGAVTTPTVASNAISTVAAAYGTDPSVTITTTGGPVLIGAMGIADADFAAYISRSGGWTKDMSLAVSSVAQPTTMFLYVETLPAGTYTYYTYSGGSPTFPITDATIYATELKR